MRGGWETVDTCGIQGMNTWGYYTVLYTCKFENTFNNNLFQKHANLQGKLLIILS